MSNTYSIADAERAAHIDEIHRLRAQLDIVTATAELAATNYQRQIAHLRAQLRRAPRTRTRKATAS
ncbi:hypothetical protein [Nocardia cyriacigeorgica]|uniref:hypothetical protein n=1 Tax=Nocardia cyriacigeorgica TaxID=135487 RepID=UPI001893B30C|nr:hypothetical protein [Nocardia cyriacigeorgica]MBF6326811.1 hypothetical protein [Nocardia cyriacigeorgica]